MNRNIEVHERPLLFDRIQLMVSPDYYLTDLNKNPSPYNEQFKIYSSELISSRKEIDLKYRSYRKKVR